MKREGTILSISGKTVKLSHGSSWELTDISTGVEAGGWMVGDQIEVEDFGVASYIYNKRRDKKLSVKKLE